MMTKQTRFTLLLLMTFLLMVGSVSAETNPPDGYNDLRDIPLIIDTNYTMGQWAAGSMEIFNGSVPVDPVQAVNGQPSYRLNGFGNDWWGFGLASELWETYDITPYFANGAIEFAVKGNAGGENVAVNLVDKVNYRDPIEVRTQQVRIGDYLTVTGNWQNVRIPLADFAIPNNFDTSAILTIEFSNTYQGSQLMWVGDIRFTSPDKEPSITPVRVNQLGYLVDGDKQAVVAGFDEELSATVGTTFQIIDATSRSVAFSGQLTEASAFDSVVSGERVLRADFSALTTPGTYELHVSAAGIAPSAPFEISNGVYDGLLVDGMRYFYLQRQGMAIDAATGGDFARGVGHPSDANAPLQSGGGNRDVSRGWYDAGDYGKYMNAAAMAVSDLLWTYELFPDQFSDNQFNIAESGNGVADILDEIKWETDWMLKMQDAASGGFYFSVAETGTAAPDEDPSPRYITDVDGGRTNVRPTAATAATVGAFAHAAMIFEDVDATYAAELLESAENGWDYLVANPGGVAPLSQIAYADFDDSGERFWAAAALFRATGEAEYSNYVVANYGDFTSKLTGTTEGAYFVPALEMLGFLSYVHSSGGDSATLTDMSNLLAGWRTAMINRSDSAVWRTTLGDDDYFWGSNMVVLNVPLAVAVASDALGTLDSDVERLSQDALNYILGANPLQMTFVTGIGSNPLPSIFSTTYSFDDVAEEPNGILSGGPNIYSTSLNYSNFAGRRFVGSDTSFTTNESTIYWNSALVFVTALLADSADSQPPAAVTLTQQSADSGPTIAITLICTVLGITGLAVYNHWCNLVR